MDSAPGKSLPSTPNSAYRLQLHDVDEQVSCASAKCHHRPEINPISDRFPEPRGTRSPGYPGCSGNNRGEDLRT